MMRGATYHQIGNPTNTTSYSAILGTAAAMAGLAFGSFISSVLRLFWSIQFRSAAEYGSRGAISYRSAPTLSARAADTFFVTPLQEK